MDCPNCGAYNATNSFRCRRCNQVLEPPAESGEVEPESSESEWGPASGSGDSWEEHFRGTPSQEPDQPAEPEDPWSRPEPEEPAQSEWSTSSSTSYSDPLPEPRSTGTTGRNLTGDVPSYLWPAIGATICCCAPLGIPAIINASRVDAHLAGGNRDAAEEASSKARNWAIAAFVVSLLFWIALFCTGQFSGATG